MASQDGTRKSNRSNRGQHSGYDEMLPSSSIFTKHIKNFAVEASFSTGLAAGGKRRAQCTVQSDSSHSQKGEGMVRGDGVDDGENDDDFEENNEAILYQRREIRRKSINEIHKPDPAELHKSLPDKTSKDGDMWRRDGDDPIGSPIFVEPLGHAFLGRGFKMDQENPLCLTTSQVAFALRNAELKLRFENFSNYSESENRDRIKELAGIVEEWDKGERLNVMDPYIQIVYPHRVNGGRGGE